MTSAEDPVAHSLSDKLGRQTGCKVKQVGEEPLNDVKVMVKERKLEWKDVAYIGKVSLHLNISKEWSFGFWVLDRNPF